MGAHDSRMASLWRPTIRFLAAIAANLVSNWLVTSGVVAAVLAVSASTASTLAGLRWYLILGLIVAAGGLTAILLGGIKWWASKRTPPDTIIFRDPNGRVWTYEYVDSLSEGEQRRLLDEREDVWKAYLREVSNRMGPPGRIGQPWPDPPIVESDSFTDQVRRHTAKWRAQSYTVALPNGTTKPYTAGHLLDLPTTERHRLLTQFPGLANWWRSLR
jgi:hypothetical protein